MTNEKAIKILDNMPVPYFILNKEPITFEEMAEAIEMAIEALKNERAKGKWGLINVAAMPYHVAYSCPFCKEWGNIQTFKPNFCPNCGADMREADNDDN